jgi:cell division protease FtsH
MEKYMNKHVDQFDLGNFGGSGRGSGSGSSGGTGGSNGQGGGNKPPKKPNIMLFLLAGLSTLFLVFLFWNFLFAESNTTVVSYTDFVGKIEAGEIDSVEINTSGVITYTLKTDSKSQTKLPDIYASYLGQAPMKYSTILMEDLNTLTGRLLEAKVEAQMNAAGNSGKILEFVGYVILPVALMWILLSLLFRRMSGSGGPMGVGKSNAKVYVQKETGVTFKDVAGEDEAKESLVEVVDFLHNPGKYSQIGAKLPKGALLVGPPGTGKTLLARAVAGEAHVPFFSLTGSDFIELYVGVGASRVRDLFKEATKNAPCIVFIDEIDAIGRSRDSKFGGGNEEREQTLNQLLSEMDGFDSSKGVLILGATNRPEILDKALLRPGRFDRRIIVDKPDLKGRVEILRVHSKDVKMDETVDLDAIALATSGAVGSDLANMINEAAINAVKEKREYVTQQDLFAAVEQVLVGKEKKDRIMSKEERRIVSYHEVGHALVSALQKNSEPVQKITIVPRTMGALGYVMHVPEEEKYLNTEAELRDMLVSLVAGRASEEIVFDTVTTGAANDIEKATGIAKAMVTQYGMSKKFGLMGLATVESQYLEGRTALNCSDTTAAEVDAEVVEILKESYEKALNLLRDNRELMDKLAAFLIEKETITGKEFMTIYRKEKGLPEPEEKEGEEQATSAETSGKTSHSTKTQGVELTISTKGNQALSSTADTAAPSTGGIKQSDTAAPSTADTTQTDTTAPSAADTTQSDTPTQSAAESTQSETAPHDLTRLQPKDDSSSVGRFSKGRLE